MLRITSVLLLLLASPAISAADWHASLSATSDYVALGISRTAGEPALQGGISWESGSGYYAGLWASRVDYGYYAAGFQDERRLETDLYLGRGFALMPDWSADIALAHYAYPGADSTRDYAYHEALASLHYRDRASLGVSLIRNLFTLGESSRSLEARLHLFAVAGVSFDTALGRVDGPGDRDYAHGRLMVSRRFSDLQVTLVWHGTDASARALFGDDRAGSRLELRLDAGL